MTPRRPFTISLTLWYEVWGRPVDVLQAADGSLLVSDDAGGRVFRVMYVGPGR